MKCHNFLFFTISVLLSLALVHKSMSSDSDVKGSIGGDWKGKIYWVLYGDGRIVQANYDGSNRSFFVETGEYPAALVIDVENKFLYWTNSGQEQSTALKGKIRRCQIDNCSSTITTIIEQGKTVTPVRLSLDRVNGYIYWSDSNRGMVQRSNLDGLNVETVLIFKDKFNVAPYGCEFDEETGDLYWYEKNGNRIGRINLANIQLPYTPKESDYIVTEQLNGLVILKLTNVEI